MTILAHRNYTFSMLKFKIFFVTLICLLALACASISEYSSPSLSNQGILPLSSSNAYLGTNLYLAKQAELSEVLYRFLDSRGAPTAIQLIDKSFASPRLLLFYPEVQEAYAAELEKDRQSYQWIVRGPFAIKRNDYSQLVRIQGGLSGPPLFVINGNQMRFKVDREKWEKSLIPPTPTFTIAPTATALIIKPTPRPRPAVIRSTPTPAGLVPSITDFKPLNTDQQALMMAKGYAERADNGDVIHTVKSDRESVADIAKWYTGNAANTAAINEANGLADEKELLQNQRIRVPLKLLKNLRSMPAK